jgi:hypothetical protein
MTIDELIEELTSAREALPRDADVQVLWHSDPDPGAITEVSVGASSDGMVCWLNAEPRS